MSIARIALRSVSFKPAVSAMATRSISINAVMQKDVVQDLFLKELKGYKPAPIATDVESAAKELKLPTPPAVPQVDADLSEQLSAYDAEPEEVSQ
ncbi:ATP synthase complex subunit H-domain-containing protein [Cokeromyces recurvatus]|uniref:ATP synthase complex subunit H-domain-containing protein n=1 Tax=Cokeromyces recurvatus TaxID=90255 RepID=UPI00221E68DD|nr:ATP synthase complex subunit H-domain-containing protein [Cokeromyces recurvatus]KAI7906529.1 ATP synthase complex subunit H-domain-containing protein [Cokeromyces recurvatus]